MSQLEDRWKEKILTSPSPYVTLLFYSAFDLLDEAHHTGESNLLYLGYLFSSINTLTDTPRMMFNQIVGHPVAQSS